MTIHALPAPASNADCVLGAMLLAPRVIDDICEIIHGEDFRDQRDEIVFNAIVAMQAVGEGSRREPRGGDLGCADRPARGRQYGHRGAAGGTRGL